MVNEEPNVNVENSFPLNHESHKFHSDDTLPNTHRKCIDLSNNNVTLWATWFQIELK